MSKFIGIMKNFISIEISYRENDGRLYRYCLRGDNDNIQHYNEVVELFDFYKKNMEDKTKIQHPIGGMGSLGSPLVYVHSVVIHRHIKNGVEQRYTQDSKESHTFYLEEKE